MQPKRTQQNDGLLISLGILTFFFILLEVSFFIQCNQSYLYVYHFVSENISIPATILPGVIFFLLTQITIHAAFCLLIWMLSIVIADLFQLDATKRLLFAITLWSFGMITIVICNQYYFPNSRIGELTSIYFPTHTITVATFILSMVGWTAIASITLFALLKRSRFSRHVTFTAISILMASIVWDHYRSSSANTAVIATAEKPNIFIIGVDSLRPDYLSYFGHETPTPFFDAFLSQATVFAEAVTPLARTFPSWVSILTGKHPRESGIRTNLASLQNINLRDTLPAIYRQQGYDTIFATDETRFSNIDQQFGFEQVITPPIGLNDFLLGSFSDFPLSNLLINTSLGQWLFPYTYANRPAYFSYDPNSFLHIVKPVLAQTRTKPIFMAIHFCLPHYPYIWGRLDGNRHQGIDRYMASIVRVDQQINDFFALLQQQHLLDHAIVIMLSDHGEALGLAGDRITEPGLFLPARSLRKAIPKFYPPSIDNEKVNESSGHGGDVLGLSQFHSLLAFRFYGVGQQHIGILPGVVSLLDIKPTLLELNQLPPSKGHSLAHTILGSGELVSPPEHIFIESDFSPEAIRTVYPDVRKVVLEGIELFQINPRTTRLTVKDSMNRMIINSKQYADIYGEWMLALYPQANHTRMPILVNLNSGQWTNDLHSPFAQKSPANLMLRALNAFYGDEIGRVS